MYTHVEYRDMIFCYGAANGSARGAVEEYRIRFPARRVPSHHTILEVFNRAGETGTFAPRQRSGRPQERPTDQVLDLFDGEPTLSTRRAATMLNKSHSSVHRSLRDDGR